MRTHILTHAATKSAGRSLAGLYAFCGLSRAVWPADTRSWLPKQHRMPHAIPDDPIACTAQKDQQEGS